MRILLVTDAWAPQINGVVVTLANTVRWLERWGHDVRVLSPIGFRTMPMPTYPEIPLALFPGSKVAATIREYDPDAIHVATEGPLGAAARAWCLKNRRAFTTAYHTCFPEYVKPRFGVPLGITYAWLRRFHAPSSAILVATPAIRELLEARGFGNIVDWSRGVDTDLFKPDAGRFSDLRRPVFLFVGRVAVEKNLPAFLGLVRYSPAPRRARSLRRITSAPTCSCFPAAPIRSAWCWWRRWRVERRWRHSRCEARSTW